MARDLSRVKDRDALKPQREPYWQRLRAGCFLGFRPSKAGGAGSWIARAYSEDTRSYVVKSLGDFGTLLPSERFTIAKKEAESFAEKIAAGGEIQQTLETVADACREYLRHKPSAISEGVFRRHVYSDPIGKVKLAKLRRHHLRDWRKRLEDTPAVISRSKEGTPKVRRRAASTVNRDMAPLRAALNKVLPHGAPGSEAAWQEALAPFPNADNRRELYLTKAQRRSLLRKSDVEASPFVHALCLLPLRPGAMAALCVSDYDRRTSELSIGSDKAKGKRRIVLPSAAAKLFDKQVKGKKPSEPIFLTSTGKAWDRNTWGDAIERAATAARLPKGTTAYTLRHATITDLVIAGLPLLTIAQISGTSAQMIERHYGHLVSEAAIKALGELEL
ncbi:tyrosine-type recombinase/integrase [Erythrobacter sp. sf7]|uniref:Tyrosine-type recombinase/integrase n=1 Tax=Erythrobacter fulvus TaxID=2987523 RepID=A0ABT5JM87_9SPHN|nr:tyrosine-type recombinase/integrase [Erythrobacter fulvus]